jgi:hypothetical protein
MNTAPAKVRHLVIRNLSSSKDLKNVRLASKALSVPATAELFSELVLPIWPFTEDDVEVFDDDFEEKSVQQNLADESDLLHRLRNILGDQNLRDQVRHVIIQTSEDPNKSIYDYHNDEEERVLVSSQGEAISLSRKSDLILSNLELQPASTDN